MQTLIAYLMLSCAAFAGAPPSEPYTREVKVPSAGWYRVPVDGHIWRYAQGRVLAFDAQGKPLPCGILPTEVTSPSSEEAQPRLVRVEEEGDKLVLYLEVEKLAGKHDRLILDFTGTDALAQAALSGSVDGKTWKEMASGTLFRLGSGDRMQGTALDYPASGFERLKLALPGGDAGLQKMAREFRVGNIRLHYAPSGAQVTWTEEPVALRPADPALSEALADPDETLYQLDLPERTYPARSLELSLSAPEGAIPASILSLGSGRVVGEYTCTLRAPIFGVPVSGGRLQAPAFIRIGRSQVIGSTVTVRRPLEDLYFNAERAGTVTLAYGGIEKRPDASGKVRLPAGYQDATLGVFHERPLELSEELTAVTRDPKFMDVQPAISWELIPPAGVAPGRWMQLRITEELPKESWKAGGEGYWAVMTDEAKAPTFRQVNPLPELVFSGTVPLTADNKDPRQVSAEITWPEERGCPIWMSASVQGAKEPLRLVVEASRPEAEKERSPGEGPVDPWTAVGQGTLECSPWRSEAKVIIKTGNVTAGRARLRLVAGELTPPADLRISMWRFTQRLVFPLPEGADARLVYGKFNENNVSFGRYLTPGRLPDDLPKGERGRLVQIGRSKGGWDRILFLAGLGLAVAVLLYLIVKLLPKREAQG
jgi:hypothetical protein